MNFPKSLESRLFHAAYAESRKTIDFTKVPDRAFEKIITFLRQESRKIVSEVNFVVEDLESHGVELARRAVALLH